MNNTDISQFFDNIYGYAGTKNELYGLALALKSIDKCSAMGIKLPTGILLYGNPGLGKTTLAKDLIAATERYAVVFRKDNGRNLAAELKKAFKLAKENQPAAILLDDMDKFSNSDSDHKNTDEYVAIQTCIDNIKNDNVVVIATANDKDCFPKSLLRAGRFDRQIHIQEPSIREATIILKTYLEKAKFSEDIDTESIARLMSGRSCAELEAIINEAGIYAIAQGKDIIDMKCMIDACLAIFYHAPISDDDVNQSGKFAIAYHEAGHAVAHELLIPNSTALVSTRISSKEKSGITVFDTESATIDFEYENKMMICALAGRAAHELKYGYPDIGSSKDIKEASGIASFMICKEGYAGIKKTELFAEFESDITKDQIDFEVNFIINKAYAESKKLLSKNFNLVEKIAQALVEQTTLLGKDVRKIIDQYKCEANSGKNL